MILNSPYITGSITVTGNANIQGQLTVTGSLSGTAATASFALTLGGTGSVGFATTGAFTAASGSASSRLTQIEQVYATTGSNSFRATQSITGSLTVTGQIIAQTLNVQQVTSSIVFSSGSNTFGCDLNSRQTFTGSVLMTGSLIVNTTGPELQVNNTGVTLGNLLTDNHSITGSLRITGSSNHFVMGCNFGIGTTCPTQALSVYKGGASNYLRIQGDNNSGYDIAQEFTDGTNAVYSGMMRGSTGLTGAYTIFTGGTARINVTSCGNVGIGTTSPCTRLEVSSTAASADRTIPHNVLTITADGNIPYGFFGGAILFKNRSYTTGLVESSRIRSVIYDDGAPANCGGGIWLETTRTPGGTLTPSLVINYAGNVGIGTTTPNALLHVVGPNAAGTFFNAQNDGAGGAIFSRINASSFPFNQYIFNNGYLGIGTASPSYTLHVEAPSNSIAAYFKAGGTAGYAALAFTGNGGTNIGVLTTSSGCIILGRSNGSIPNQFGANLDFLINCANGNILINASLGVAGSVSKGSGSFKIKHPLASKKCTHQLVHSFIEGPQADLIYSGHTALQNGISCINMDCAARMTEGTFLALNRCLRVFTTNETSWDQVKGRVIGNVLIVESQNTESNDEISWMVIGERQDEHMLETEWTDDEGRVITEPEIVQ